MSQWWLYQKGANWREPEGPGSTNAGRQSYPVVHVAYEDALAYARWLGRELPTEAQWEFAARGGRAGEQDWMSAFDADGKPIANTWQGVFPVYNTAEDGYAGAAPAGCFKPNGYGLYDMIGNVWEWTSDWYRPGHSRDAADNPAGPGSDGSAPGRRRAAEQGHQGRLVSVLVQLLRALPADGAPAAGGGPERGPPRLPHRAQCGRTLAPCETPERQLRDCSGGRRAARTSPCGTQQILARRECDAKVSIDR